MAKAYRSKYPEIRKNMVCLTVFARNGIIVIINLLMIRALHIMITICKKLNAKPVHLQQYPDHPIKEYI